MNMNKKNVAIIELRHNIHNTSKGKLGSTVKRRADIRTIYVTQQYKNVHLDGHIVPIKYLKLSACSEHYRLLDKAVFRVAQSTISRLLQRVNALTGDVLTALRQELDVKKITYET